MTTIKMSQIKRDDWKQNPLDYVTKPQQTNLERVTPQLSLAPAVKDALKKLDAIGFDISTLEKAFRITRHLADPSISEAIADMGPTGYATVYSQHIKGTPPPQSTPPSAPPTVGDVVQGNIARISMKMLAAYQQEEMAELLRLLMDAGFRMDDPTRAGMILSELSGSNAPSADMARQMVSLTQNPAAYEQLMTQAAMGAQYQNPPKRDYPVVLDQTLPPSGPVKTKEEVDRERAIELMEQEEINKQIDEDMQGPRYQEQLQNMRTKLPGAPPPTPPAAPSPVTPTPVAPSPAPKAAPLIIDYVPGQGGAQGKTKAMMDMVALYPQMQQRLPSGSTPIQLGDNVGVPVFPEDKSKKFKLPSKGGEMVVAYDTMEEAMIVGKTGDNKLAVFTFPYLQPDIWDVDARQVRRSLRQPKRQ